MIVDVLIVPATVATFWAVVALAARPVLSLEPLSTALADYPTDSKRRNRLLLTGGLTATHVIAFLGVVAASGRLEGTAVFEWFLGVGGSVALGAWLVGAVVLPGLGRWRLSTRSRLVLAAAALWYVVVSVLAVVAAMAVVVAFTFPG